MLSSTKPQHKYTKYFDRPLSSTHWPTHSIRIIHSQTNRIVAAALHCVASYPTMLHSVSHPLPTFGFCYFQSAGSIDAILSRPPKTSLPVTIHKGTSAVSRTLAALVQTREKKRDRFRKIFAFSTRHVHTLSYQMNPPADAEKPTHPTIPGTTWSLVCMCMLSTKEKK